MTTRSNAIAALWLLGVALSGCAAAFLNGGTPHTGAPRMPEATYAPACNNGQTYVLARSSSALVLYELDATGKGAAITNHWADGKGDFFAVSVSRGPAWQYFFPADRSLPAARLEYGAGTYRTTTQDGGLRITGAAPSGNCPLMPR